MKQEGMSNVMVSLSAPQLKYFESCHSIRLHKGARATSSWRYETSLWNRARPCHVLSTILGSWLLVIDWENGTGPSSFWTACEFVVEWKLILLHPLHGSN